MPRPCTTSRFDANALARRDPLVVIPQPPAASDPGVNFLVPSPLLRCTSTGQVSLFAFIAPPPHMKATSATACSPYARHARERAWSQSSALTTRWPFPYYNWTTNIMGLREFLNRGDGIGSRLSYTTVGFSAVKRDIKQ